MNSQIIIGDTLYTSVLEHNRNCSGDFQMLCTNEGSLLLFCPKCVYTLKLSLGKQLKLIDEEIIQND